MGLTPGWVWDETDAAVQVAMANGLSAYLYARDLGDGRGVWVMPTMFGNGRLVFGPIEGQWLEGAYCYDSAAQAVAAASAWDGLGDPEGWKRHVETGRRRPGGDPSKEYVEF